MAQLQKVEVLIKTTYDDGTETEATYTGAHGSVVTEVGYDNHQEGLVILKEPNGQNRVCIKLWTGIRQFGDLRQGC